MKQIEVKKEALTQVDTGGDPSEVTWGCRLNPT